jgi:hypothetical protein
MRWVKHLTMAHADKAMAVVLEEFGAEAYGVFWLMIEDIAAPMEKGKFDPSAIHSIVKWSQICHCSARVLRSIAKRLEEKRLIVVESVENRWQITVPNILKYKDEYAKKSGHNQEQDRDINRDRDTDTDTEEKPTAIGGENPPQPPAAPPALSLVPPPKETDTFEEFWALYPRKVSKASARKTWRRKATTVRAAEEIIFGLKAQTPALLLKDLEFRPHASTWLNQERWKDPVESKARDSPPQNGKRTLNQMLADITKRDEEEARI